MYKPPTYDIGGSPGSPGIRGGSQRTCLIITGIVTCIALSAVNIGINAMTSHDVLSLKNDLSNKNADCHHHAGHIGWHAMIASACNRNLESDTEYVSNAYNCEKTLFNEYRAGRALDAKVVCDIERKIARYYDINSVFSECSCSCSCTTTVI